MTDPNIPPHHEPVRPEAPAESSQARYVQELLDFARAIPATFQNPLPIVPSARDLEQHRERAVFLSTYAAGASASSQLEDAPPLYREDIVDPRFCQSVDSMTRAVEGASEGGFHWYKPANRRQSELDRRSRRWDIAYLRYMKQRRDFHALFMQAALTGAEPAEFANMLADIQRLEVPTTSSRLADQTRTLPPPDFFYNRTNWAAASLASALMLPPHQCSASMKRRAVELFAVVADPNDLEDRSDYYDLRSRDSLNQLSPLQDQVAKQRLRRLPWSMQERQDELRALTHDDWRQNAIILQYFGPQHDPRADGWARLLQERPKDYVQVLLLHLYATMGSYQQRFRDIAAAAKLTPQIKDIIFADDASFNTVYKQPSTFVERAAYMIGLNELLQAVGGPDTETERVLLGLERLRAQAVVKELRIAQGGLAVAVDELTTARQTIAGFQSTLYESYGLNPRADPMTLDFAVRAVRAAWRRRLLSPRTLRRLDASGQAANREQFERIERDLGVIRAEALQRAASASEPIGLEAFFDEEL